MAKESNKTAGKHIHIVGICGVGTSALAIAFHKAGWKVTGSDKGIYPPVSTSLTESGVEYYTGWHPEKFDAPITPSSAGVIEGIGRPDVFMVGGSGTSLSNPEVMYAKEHGIPFHPYSEILNKYFIRQNSIVTVGTWGKTTTSALLSFILIEAGMNPSYFCGGLSLSHPTGALTPDLGEKSWSVVEGDEYQVAIYDRRPKFVYYNPTHLLLTSISWDHADLYPTEAEYFKTFENLVNQIPPSTNKRPSAIIACADDAGVRQILAVAGRTDAITYGLTVDSDYRYSAVTHTKAGIAFDIKHEAYGLSWHITSPMLGRFNAENIAGAFAMAHHIGIPAEKIIASLVKFQGIKRRLERRLDGEKEITAGGKGITVLDCHAPTPEKAASVLESIREVYTQKIIAIYEPNIGGRQRASIDAYNNAFKNADIVLLPHFTKLKVDSTKTDTKDQPLESSELAAFISKTNPNAISIEDDATLVARAISEAKKGDVIAFLGSHGFRGMIEEVVRKLQK